MWEAGLYSTCVCLIKNETQIDAVLFASHCLFLSSFQLKMMGFGRMVSPMNVVHCCLKPSITCWNAASWIAVLFALGNGLWNPTRRTRSLLTRGMLTELSPMLSLVSVHVWFWTWKMCIFMFSFLVDGILDIIRVLILSFNMCLCGPGQVLL